MNHIRTLIAEIWICPPTCERVHQALDVAHMFGGEYKHGGFLVELRRYGLQPCAGDNSKNYKYRCQDIQGFAYECQVPLGIDYRLRDREPRGSKRYRQFANFEKSQKTKLSSPARAYLPVRTEQGDVYLLRWGSYFKIGLSRDVEARVRSLNSMPLDAPIELVHTVASDQIGACERLLHRRFAEYRVKGTKEWFELPEDAVQWICSLKAGELDDELRKTVGAGPSKH